MKKAIFMISILTFALIVLFMGNTYAAPLNSIGIDTNKQVVRPGEDVALVIDFGQELGSYKFTVDFDDDVFDYVSVEGGTANATADKVVVEFHAGTTARESETIVFKAKDSITTSNPTEFSVTADGLANSDASVEYDEITTPMVATLTVEPEYQDYTINLTYTGEITVGEEKPMVLSYGSSMGRYYGKARLVAEVETPDNGSMKLEATDAATQAKQDIILSGYGDPQGYPIGGKDVLQELNVAALFTEEGEYKLTLKLIDRDNTDAVIAEKEITYQIGQTVTGGDNNNLPDEGITGEQTQQEEKPKELPKTGYNIYLPIMVGMMTIGIATLYYSKKNSI